MKSEAQQDWTTATLIGQWSMEQLFENAVSVRLQDKALAYVQLPDGSYNPPPGMTTALVKNGSLFELRERFGTVIAFDASNRISTWTDVDGNQMSFTYSGNNLATVTDSVGRSLTLTYTGSQLTSVTDSSGRVINYSYGLNGDLATFSDADGQPWGFGYDTDHRITTVRDALNVTLATNTYDALDQVDTQTYPRDGLATVTFNYYFSGFRNSEQDSNGNSTVYHIDRQGRTVAVEDALGHNQKSVFDGQNHVVQSIDPLGNPSAFTYDGNQNLRFSLNALSQQSENVYDVLHRLTETLDPLAHSTQFAYDAEHHLTLTTDALGNTAGASYTPEGRTQTSTDGRGTVTHFSYDLFGNPDTTQAAAHPLVDHAYDAIGRRLSLTDQAGAVTQFVYDNRGLVTRITDPLLQTTSFVYDATGRVSSRTDRNGQTINFAYTPSGKTKTITYPDTSSVAFTYDLAWENVVSMSDALGANSYTYDAANRLTGQTGPNGFSVSYGYDAAGNITALTYPGNKTVTYGYDALNRLVSVSDWLGQTASYSYDAAGRLTQTVNFNGSISQYTYDNANRLVSLVNKKSDGTVLSSHGFTLDANGNRTQEIRDVPTAPVNWAVENVPFTYNATANRLLNTDTDTFAYDNEGQQSLKNTTPYSWDYEHRLTGIGADTLFAYDGVGNRLQASRGGVITKYIYDANGNLLAEADATNTITRYYVYGSALLAAVTPAGQSYSYHFDGVGHTVAMTDATETLINSYSYSPYGRLIDQQETLAQPFKYVGQYGVMTEANGLYYMRARYYDPSTGRFISEDPTGFEGGQVNLYAYVGGNPIGGIDPTGLYLRYPQEIAIKNNKLGIKMIS